MSSDPSGRSRRFLRVRWTWPKSLFALWAALVFTGTHWPNARIEMAGRPDLILHMSLFAPWTILVARPGFFGPRWSMQNIGTSCIVALAYAAFDESSQAIPILHRTAALDDFGADCAGVLLASLVLTLIARRRAIPPSGAPDAR